MDSLFEIQKEFIETDVRKDRKDVSYSVTAELMEMRHRFLMPESLVRRRSVLDLGACVAATGAWALHHGAKRYTGIEIDAGFAAQARANLSQHHPGAAWNIIEDSIEHFLENNQQKFDIVMASGIIYTVLDLNDLLRKLTDIAGTVIIESPHPICYWEKVLKHCLPESALSEFDPTYLFEQIAITSLRQNYMVDGDSGEHHTQTYGAFPSMSALEMMMANLGFRSDREPYHQLKQALPDPYDQTRYALVFHKNKNASQYKTVADIIAERIS